MSLPDPTARVLLGPALLRACTALVPPALVCKGCCGTLPPGTDVVIARGVFADSDDEDNADCGAATADSENADSVARAAEKEAAYELELAAVRNASFLTPHTTTTTNAHTDALMSSDGADAAAAAAAAAASAGDPSATFSLPRFTASLVPAALVFQRLDLLSEARADVVVACSAQCLNRYIRSPAHEDWALTRARRRCLDRAGFQHQGKYLALPLGRPSPQQSRSKCSVSVGGDERERARGNKGSRMTDESGVAEPQLLSSCNWSQLLPAPPVLTSLPPAPAPLPSNLRYLLPPAVPYTIKDTLTLSATTSATSLQSDVSTSASSKGGKKGTKGGNKKTSTAAAAAAAAANSGNVSTPLATEAKGEVYTCFVHNCGVLSLAAPAKARAASAKQNNQGKSKNNNNSGSPSAADHRASVLGVGAALCCGLVHAVPGGRYPHPHEMTTFNSQTLGRATSNNNTTGKASATGNGKGGGAVATGSAVAATSLPGCFPALGTILFERIVNYRSFLQIVQRKCPMLVSHHLIICIFYLLHIPCQIFRFLIAGAAKAAPAHRTRSLRALHGHHVSALSAADPGHMAALARLVTGDARDSAGTRSNKPLMHPYKYVRRGISQQSEASLRCRFDSGMYHCVFDISNIVFS